MSIGSVHSGAGNYAEYALQGCCGRNTETRGGRFSEESGGTADAGAVEGSGDSELSKEEQQQVTELKKRDREVRAHEAAHMGAGGGVVRGGASYSFQAGPDGRKYAVGGEVGIDASPVKDNPEATIRKMQKVRAAALAPASPSGQDQAVASAASAQEAAARMELNKDRGEEQGADSEKTSGQAESHGQKSLGYTGKGTLHGEDPVTSSQALDLSA